MDRMNRKFFRLLAVLAGICLLYGIIWTPGIEAGFRTAAVAEDTGEPGDGHSGSSEGHGNEADGSKIESIHIHWITPDNPDDSVADNLYLRTTDRDELRMRYQIDVSFSGQFDYEPGNIRINIPKGIWHKRANGSTTGETGSAVYGGMSFSVPDASSDKTDWHYEVNADGSYSIVNTHTIPSTSKAMFQFTITEIYPQYIVDEKLSDNLAARVEVVTNEGNTIHLDSNVLTAQIDTEEKLRGGSKGGTLYEFPEDVPAPMLANLPAGANSKDYIYVKWYVYPNFDGNQYFSLSGSDAGSLEGVDDTAAYVGVYQETIDPDTGKHSGWEHRGGAIMLGAVDSSGKALGSVSGNNWTNDILTLDFATNGMQQYNHVRYVWTAYKKSDFPEMNVNYQFRNQSYWTLTEQDPAADYPAAIGGTDPKLVTTASAKDSVEYFQADWHYPPGRFLSYKYTESTTTHKHSTSSSDEYNNTTHKKNHTYDLALNRLRNGNPVVMNYEVLSVGYGGIFTCGPLAGTIGWEDEDGNQHEGSLDPAYNENWNSAAWADDMDHYLNWYYVMDTTDRWEWFSIVDGKENTRLKESASDDYRFLGITIASPEIFQWDKQRNPMYYFGNTTYGFAPDETIPKPAVEVWVEYDNEAAITDTNDTREPSEATGWHYVGSFTVESGKTQYVDFEGMGNVTGYRTRITSNQAATKLAVFPKIELKPSERVIGIVEQLFEESEAPSTPYRNDENMYVELYKYPEDPANTAPQQAYYIPQDKYYRQFINHDDSRATLTGGGYGVSPEKTVSYDAVADNDPENRSVTLHYTGSVTEASNVHSELAWREAVSLGAIKPEMSGTWYDLLPEGVQPVLSTVKPTRTRDKVISVKTYPNWRNTGRIMMVVEMELTPVPRTQSGSGIIYDEPGIKFDATYAWTDINNIGAKLVNYIAFESGDDERLGTLKDRIGEADAMVPVNNRWTLSGEPAQIVEAFRDLDPTSDQERFVYAKATVNLNVDQMAETEYVKSVQSDLDGIWTQGLEGQTQVNLYEGQTYTYRLRVASCKDTITSNMVMYDSLENYIIPSGLDETKDRTKLADYNEVQSKKDWDGDWDRATIQVGAAGNKEDLEIGGQWRGKLLSIDVSDFIRQGCAPVIYYATEPWLQFGDTTGDIVDETIFFNYLGRYDITDECWKKVPASAIQNGIWTVPEGTDVTAIALDLRKTPSGGSFELHSQEATYALLHMVAPDDHGDENQWHAKGAYAHKNEDGSASSNQDIDWEKALDPKNNMHAYNNTRLICSQADENNPAASSRITMIRNDYTRIGIMPRIIMVEKVRDDDDNHDNKRPASITVTMKRKLKTGTKWETVKDETTGKALTVTLSEDNEWQDIFYQQDAVDEQGREWEYTFEENTIPGYTASAQKIDDTHFRFTNTHENEQTEVSGEKLWRLNDGQLLPADVEALIPSSVTVKLYRTGTSGEPEYVKSLTVKPDEDGRWQYTFTGLDKYERGGFEYMYSIEEAPVKYFFSSTEDPSVLPEGYTIGQAYDPDSTELIYNFYFPFGDLQVDKTILDATAVSETQEFTYTLMLEGGDGLPVEGSFDYKIYNVATNADTGAETLTVVSSGKIGHEETFALKGGQRIVIKKLPADARYTLTEDREDGWTLTGKTGDTGTVPTATVAKASFTNRYHATGNATVGAKKSLTGHQLKRNQFRFEMTDMTEGSETYGQVIRNAGNAVPEDTAQDEDTGVITNTSEFTFGALSYTEKDHGKTFTYEIREVIPEGAEDQGDGIFLLNGYIYDASVRTVNVRVTDNGDGTMTTVVSPEAPADNLFSNKYEAEGDVTLKVFKRLLKRDLKDHEFEFELWKSDENGTEIEKIEGAVFNDEEGGVTFSTLHFTQDDVTLDPEHPAKYYYLVKEIPGEDNTVIYTETSHLFTVTVYDMGNGKLTFAQEGQAVDFEHIDCDTCGGTGSSGGLVFIGVSEKDSQEYGFGNLMENGDFEVIPLGNLGGLLQTCPNCGGTGYSEDDYNQYGSNVCLRCWGFGMCRVPSEEAICHHENMAGSWCPDCFMGVNEIELVDGDIYTGDFGPDGIMVQFPIPFLQFDLHDYTGDPSLFINGLMPTYALLFQLWECGYDVGVDRDAFTEAYNAGDYETCWQMVSVAVPPLEGQPNYYWEISKADWNEYLNTNGSQIDEWMEEKGIDPWKIGYFLTTGAAEECPDCGGLGYTLGNPIISAETGAAPVFTNDLKDGALQVNKTVTVPDPQNPNQEFTFHVKFSGEYLAEAEITTGHEDENGTSVETGNNSGPHTYYVPRPGDCDGEAYAVLYLEDEGEHTAGELYFYRDYNAVDLFTTPPVDENGNELTGWPLLSVDGSSYDYIIQQLSYATPDGKKIYFRGFEKDPGFTDNIYAYLFYYVSYDPESNTTYYDNDTNNISNLIQKITQRDPIQPDTSYLTALDVYDSGRGVDMFLDRVDCSHFKSDDYYYYLNYFTEWFAGRSLDFSGFYFGDHPVSLDSFLYYPFYYYSYDYNYANTYPNQSAVLPAAKVTSAAEMAEGCYLLENIDMSGVTWTGKVSVSYMFNDCTALRSLDLTGLTLSNTTNMDQYMLYNTVSLRQITIEDDFCLPDLPADHWWLPEKEADFDWLEDYGIDFTVLPDAWTNTETGETLTSYELFSTTGHGGTWVRGESYTINFDGNGGSGSMKAKGQAKDLEMSFKPFFFKLGSHVGSVELYRGSDLLATLEPNENGAFTIDDTVTSQLQNGDEITAKMIWVRDDGNTNTDEITVDFQLRDGERMVFENVPASTSYEVWEETPRGWILVGRSGDSGAIEPTETSLAEFTNEYAPNKTTASLTASKRLDGKMSRRAFTFGLYEVAADGTETLIDSKENTAGGVASFDIITYDLQQNADAEGLHTYRIREIPDDPADPTIVYDEHGETATVLVEKLPDPNDADAFIATSTVTYNDEDGNKSNGIFRNETKPGSLKISKTIQSASEKAAETEFSIRLLLQTNDYQPITGTYPAIRTAEDGTEAEETVTTGKDGTVILSMKGGETLQIDELPDKTCYTLTEVDIPAAWEQTAAEGEEGKIASTLIQEASYENTYSMKGEAVLRTEKQVEGETAIEEGQYTFELEDRTEGSKTQGQIIGTVSNAATDEQETVTDPVSGEDVANPDLGKAIAQFPKLTYTAEGTYTYIIREKALSEGDEGYDPKMIYDDREITVTVEMKDEAGEGILTPTVTYAGGEGENENAFLNTFRPGFLEISKIIEDATEVSAEQVFTMDISLKDRDGNALTGTYDVVRTEENGKETEETLEVSGGKGEITLKGGEKVLISGLPHQATWELTEQGADGWTQTGAEGTAGTIESTETGTVTVTNTYEAKGSVVLEARKKMDPADIPMTAEMFSFILRDEKGGELQRAKNDGDGKGVFEPLTYTQADAGKTFTYTILEQQGVNKATKTRYSFDTRKYTVKVSVTDNGDGTLKTEATYSLDGTGTDEALFTNSSSVNIPIRKVWDADGEVVAEIRPEYVLVELLANGEVIATRSVAVGMAAEEGGSVWETMFTGMPEYKGGKKVTYSVREVEASAANYAAAFSADGDTQVVTNTYHETDITFSGVKELANKDLEDGQFSFTIRVKNEEEAETTPLPEECTVTNAADGTFSFGKITYRLGDLDWAEDGSRLTTAKKTYVITEDIPEGAVLAEDGTRYLYDNIFYDTTEYEVTVTLTFDPKTGAFTAKADMEPSQIIFRNESVKADVTVKKIWDDNNDRSGKRSGVKATITLVKTVNGKTTDLETVTVGKEDNWSKSWKDLPAYSEDGKKITYSARENLETANGYTKGSMSVSGTVITFTNIRKEEEKPPVTPTRYEFTFTKEWQGGTENGISFTLYRGNGSVYDHGFDRKKQSDTVWKYSGWLSGEDDGCYVIENAIPGYQTRYENVGKYADVTDRCYNGGKIINYKIPKTGDTVNLPLVTAIVAISAIGLAVLIIRERRYKKRKSAEQ